MKKTITAAGLILVAFISSSAFIANYSTGITGYTGAPGETSCSTPGCHGGGSSAASGVTITATPSFTNDEYVPGTTYTMAIAANASGFTHYGFDCEILDPSNASIGTMQLPGTGVKFLFSGSKKNAVHTTPKTGSTAIFTFQWVAPAEGSGDATVYASANAVNNNGSSNGDFPIAPVSLALTEAAPVVDTTIVTGIRNNQADMVSQLSVYPNPSGGITHLSYALKQNGAVLVELLDLSGKTIKVLLNEKQFAGNHSQLLSLQGAPSGVYFLKTSVNDQKVAQKLITVQ